MTKKRKIIIIGVASALVVLLVGGVFWWHRYWRSYYGYEPLEFSKEAWAAADAEHRGHMLKDFRKKYELKGMTYDEVIALLGEPDRKYTDKDTGKVSSIYYDVGHIGYNPRAMFAFPFELYIDLLDNKVQDHRILDD